MEIMKSKNINIVLFDLGNTLLYFNGSWSQVIAEMNLALAYSFQRAGLVLDTQAFVVQVQKEMEEYYAQRQNEYFELTTADVIQSVLDDFGYPNIPDDVMRKALKDMYAVSQDHWHPEEDSLPTLEQLRGLGYHLGLISNAGDDADVQLLIDKGGYRHYFDIILVSAAQGIRKPNPDIFYKALAAWNASPSQAAMIGDTLEADIQGARNAGITSIWITRRAGSSANIPPGAIVPDASIAALSDLPGLLAKL